MKKTLCFLAVSATVAATSSATLLYSDFAGPYAPVNWTQLVSNGGNGFVVTSGAPASISLTSSDDGSDQASDVDFTITSLISAVIQFNWSYSTADFGNGGNGPSFDPFGWLLNGAYTQVTNDVGPLPQAGLVSFSVVPGDTFGFSQRSVDSGYGAATTTISSFTVSDSVSAVPEPSGILGLGCVLAGGLLIRRRDRKVQS